MTMMAAFKNPHKFIMQIVRRVSDLEWRLVLLILLPLSLLVFVSISAVSVNPSSYFLPIKSLICRREPPRPWDYSTLSVPKNFDQLDEDNRRFVKEKAVLDQSRMAVCLVGGARRFELTGPSIVQKILKVYPNSDLFLHSPMDSNSYKFSLLKAAPRIASVKIFKPKPIPETESQLRVLTSANSPNGIQGLLQYFNLVEGCIAMIKAYQEQNNFTYDWIVRTRVDGYWSAPLAPYNFIKGLYVIPPGSSYGGLNDRFGIGDFNSSAVALSRLSLIPKLNSSGYQQLNSERAFKAQLTTEKVPYKTKRIPFCIVTDRKYEFPPARYGVPVATLSSKGPLSGAKCRPCTAVCSGPTVGNVMSRLDRGWSYTDWANGTLELCDAHGEWEIGWEKLFDRAAGKKLATARKKVSELKLAKCASDFDDMKKRAAFWEAPSPAELCSLGLAS